MQRTLRSRSAIVRALFELIGEGVMPPTAQQVAERAGVGIRTIFRHFSEMDTLYAELDLIVRDALEPCVAGAPPEGGIEARVHWLAGQRARFFERAAPYLRATHVMRWRSAFLQRGYAASVRELRGSLRRCLPELTDAPVELADAIEAAASFEVWDRLRREQRLSLARAEAAMERTLQALIGELEK